MEPKFIHLNLHSEYTINAGIVALKNLCVRCQELKFPALALTDPNLFASLKFYEQTLASGIKPIIGAELKILLGNEVFIIEVLAKNYEGYLNLLNLVSKPYLNGEGAITSEYLSQHNEGLIILSGNLSRNLSEENLNYFKHYFSNNFYLEISRIGLPNEELVVQKIVKISQVHNLPIVATNKVYFLLEEDYESHEIKVCINGSYLLAEEHRPHYQTSQYLKSAQEMEEIFQDLPESLTNTVEIAKRCNVTLEIGKTFLPNFPMPSGETVNDHLTNLATEGLKEYLTKAGDLSATVYWERLEYELSIIKQMGYSGYFLIVSDFINWSKNNHIPVGPGRGSGAGSLVAYILKITDLDPLKYQLLFERFLNPERVSMPDFDVDFCMTGRDKVIKYVMERYGNEKVAQIITYGTMAAKAVIRDVGRVLGYPYGFVDQIAKLIPFTLGITLEEALKEEELLRKRYETETEVKILIDNARKLEGLVRNVGKHAGGVVIAPTALINFSALFDQGEGIVTQLDKDDIEKIGLVKFDFLGLKTLTVIDWALKAIHERQKLEGQSLLNLSEISLEDPSTYQLMSSGNTVAIFQLESRIAKDVIKKFKPNCFSDMLALVAIIRPGVLQSGMVAEILDRKNGKAKITYLHPKLEPVLKETYGIVIYQEQVMQIAQILAGYSLGEADLLRRAMGKKKIQEMEMHRSIFTERAIKQGVDKKLADEIFNYMEKFASYGFNKSHSAAYGLIAYQTAWLKKHFSAEFMAAILSSEMTNTDKLVATLGELSSLDLNILPPNVQTSEFHFKAVDQNNILYGLGAIKGVGEGAVEAMLQNRPRDGFINLKAFLKKMDWQKGNKRFLEALIYSGSLDVFGFNRGILFSNINYLIDYASEASGQLLLWEEDQNEELVLSSDESFQDGDRLIHEKEVLGTYFSGHPIQSFLGELAKFTELGWNKIKTKTRMKVAGFLGHLKLTMTKTGKKMGILTLETEVQNLEVVLFSELFSKSRHKLVKNQLLIVEGELGYLDGNYSLRSETVVTLMEAREEWSKGLKIILGAEGVQNDLIEALEEAPKGDFKVFCELIVGEEPTLVLLDKRYKLEEFWLKKLEKLKDITLEFLY